MSSRIIQGQSLATIDKERCIGSALSVSMQVASHKFAGYPFWHFDANSGTGWNENVDVPGSPLVFWELARRYLTSMFVGAFFSEIKKDSAKLLYNRLKAYESPTNSSFVLPGDNAEGLEVFAGMIRRFEKNPPYAVGSVIVDPNGYFYRSLKGIGAPVDQLIEFSAEFPRVDVILNLNVRQYRLQKSQGFKQMSVTEVFSSLNKKHWIVKITQVGGNEFLLAVGRNMPTGEHKGLGMHSTNSAEGKHILNRIEGSRQMAMV